MVTMQTPGGAGGRQTLDGEKMEKRYFALTMDDYATASFCSRTKDFYGTLSDIAEYIRQLPERSFATTKAALQEYLDGNENAAHHVCFCDHKLLTPVEMIKQERFDLAPYAWDHANIFDCIYKMKADAAAIEQILIKQGNWYIRCARCVFTNLQYMSESPLCKGYQKMPNRFWGLPGMIRMEADRYILRLYVREKYYTRPEEALGDMGKADKLDLANVCNEIFADG